MEFIWTPQDFTAECGGVGRGSFGPLALKCTSFPTHHTILYHRDIHVGLHIPILSAASCHCQQSPLGHPLDPEICVLVLWPTLGRVEPKEGVHVDLRSGLGVLWTGNFWVVGVWSRSRLAAVRGLDSFPQRVCHSHRRAKVEPPKHRAHGRDHSCPGLRAIH